MGYTVVGIYDRLDDARSAMHELVNRGFSIDRIDLSADEGQNVRADKERTSGFFNSLFGNTNEARSHTEAADKGYVVTVHASDSEEAERVATVLDDYGAIDPAESYAAGAGETEYTETAGTEKTTSTPSSETSIPVIEEEMEVGKREVETGKVRIRSRIIERPVEEHLRLRTEYVDVERVPVNRPASSADFDQFKEGDIEITEHAEEPVVNKEARVVEEVKVKKEVQEREETMRGSVKRQDVEVDEKNKERKI